MAPAPPPPHPLLYISEVCYQLVPSTPGDTGLRGLGVPQVSLTELLIPPAPQKLPTLLHMEHQLPMLANPSWPFSLLCAVYPTHHHPVCSLPSYVQVCHQQLGPTPRSRPTVSAWAGHFASYLPGSL